MQQIYNDGTYLENNPSWHEEGSAWKAQKIINILEDNSLSPQSICEVGCGTGEILNQLAQHYRHVDFSGYEISEQAYERSKSKSREKLNFYLADILLEDKYFDVAMAIDVFEHIEDYFDFLRKLRTKAEYKVFHIPIELSVFNVIRAYPLMRARTGVGHIHSFTKETALATLTDTGYEIIDYFYTAHSELPYMPFKSRMLGHLRKLAFTINQDLSARILGGYSLMVLTR